MTSDIAQTWWLEGHDGERLPLRALRCQLAVYPRQTRPLHELLPSLHGHGEVRSIALYIYREPRRQPCWLSFLMRHRHQPVYLCCPAELDEHGPCVVRHAGWIEGNSLVIFRPDGEVVDG